MDDSNSVRFIRITVIGASSSGKTCLINSFVNRKFPPRYARTEKAVVYLKETELRDETDYNESWRPVLVEVEDTPGSERGEDTEDDGRPASDGAGKIVKGAHVVVLKEKAEVVALFKQYASKLKGLAYRPGMDAMLGKEYTVKYVDEVGCIYLPSPDGSEGGQWAFPPGAAKLKMSLELPIDKFLTLAEKEKVVLRTLKEKKLHSEALQHPLSAYVRPIGGADTDKTLTRNRMGYFICFDISDESGSSLKEAMAVHQMLFKSLEKRQSILSPLIWLIGCKSDSAGADSDRSILESARDYADRQELIVKVTSAKQHKNVNDVFMEMIQAISAKANLWTLHGEAAEEGDDEDQSACFSQ